jgi:2-haloacid dehalogenase
MVASPTPPRSPMPPDVIAFDLFGTLCSLTSLEPLLGAAGGDASTLERWFAETLRDGFALAAARSYQPFRDVAKASLVELLPKARPAARDKVLAGLGKLDAWPDAAPAMGRAALDARVIVVTNASVATARKLLAATELDTFVEAVVSADDVKAWKPRADAYSYAAATTDTAAERLGIVTAHPWDVLGGAQAGLVTGWCNRGAGGFPPAFGHPDVTGATLVDVVDGLFALKGGR